MPYIPHTVLTISLGAFIFFNLLFQLISVYSTSPEIRSPFLGFQRPKPKLRISEDGTFTIAVFSDFHFGEEESGVGPENDRKTTVVMNGVLDVEKPDFVVLNGDLITGEKTFLENSTQYIHQLALPMVNHSLPWASTYGNHDTQYNLSREALFSEESLYSLSYTQHSPFNVGGVTNYWIPIYASTSIQALPLLSGQGTRVQPGTEIDDETPVAILWFFDSLGGENFQRSRLFRWMPNWVVAEAVTWFQTQNALIQKRWPTSSGAIPSLAFVHIPPSSFLAFSKTAFPHGKKNGKGVQNKAFPGINDDIPVDEQGHGRWFRRDQPFVDALRGTKGLHSVYSGHDHGDTWCGGRERDEGPFMCFCKHTGYGGYGDWKRGGRVISLGFGKEEMKVDTWIRMESGEVVQRVGLNSTYGSDVYSLANGE